MNELISFEVDNKVAVGIGAPNWFTCRMDDAGYVHIHGGGDIILSHESRKALLDILNCADTGSFAALADTSAVPFVRKRMRTLSWDGEYVVTDIREREIGLRHASTHGLVSVDRSCLLPLTPAVPPVKKVRAYTAKEFAEKWFCEETPLEFIERKTGRRMYAKNMNKYGVTIRPREHNHDQTCGRFLEWDQLNKEMKWPNHNDCGVVEP